MNGQKFPIVSAAFDIQVDYSFKKVFTNTSVYAYNISQIDNRSTITILLDKMSRNSTEKNTALVKKTPRLFFSLNCP